MTVLNESNVKSFVINYLIEKSKGNFNPGEYGDSFDFLEQGILDSIGLLDLISAMENHFKVSVDFEKMDPEEFTILGAFSRYVVKSAKQNE